MPFLLGWAGLYALPIVTGLGITSLLLLALTESVTQAIPVDMKLWLLCFSLLGITLTIAIYLNHKLSQPILGLSQANQPIAVKKGNESFIPLASVKELANLAETLSQLSQEVQQLRQTVENDSRLLEQKVYERTRALEQELDRRTAAEAMLYQANRELEQIAFVDSLTQVANRRYFDDSLNREWWQHRRMKASLSVILCDIDYFKQYNDAYGHQAGDHCLAQVAMALESVAKRSVDVVARYGGEEFAVILPETSITGAIWVAHQIQAAIRQLQLAHSGSRVHSAVTLSFGVASVIPDPEVTPCQLIASADRALYQAKSKGRNCIVSSEIQVECYELQLA